MLYRRLLIKKQLFERFKYTKTEGLKAKKDARRHLHF